MRGVRTEIELDLAYCVCECIRSAEDAALVQWRKCWGECSRRLFPGGVPICQVSYVRASPHVWPLGLGDNGQYYRALSTGAKNIISIYQA
jgi:hypothetical protein